MTWDQQRLWKNWDPPVWGQSISTRSPHCPHTNTCAIAAPESEHTLTTNTTDTLSVPTSACMGDFFGLSPRRHHLSRQLLRQWLQTGRWTNRQMDQWTRWTGWAGSGLAQLWLTRQRGSVSPSVIFSEPAVSESIHRNINTLLGEENRWAMFHCILNGNLSPRQVPVKMG